MSQFTYYYEREEHNTNGVGFAIAHFKMGNVM